MVGSAVILFVPKLRLVWILCDVNMGKEWLPSNDEINNYDKSLLCLLHSRIVLNVMF
jgi:hypothetical protein